MRAPNLFPTITPDSSPLIFLKTLSLIYTPLWDEGSVRSWLCGMGVGAMGTSGRRLWGSQLVGHHQGGNRDWQFAFPADRSSLLIDYLIIDFPRSQCAAALAGAPPDWPSPPPRLPTEIWVSSFSSRPQGEFSVRFQLEGGKKNPARSRASCEPCSRM